jgi:hypothetical protein
MAGQRRGLGKAVEVAQRKREAHGLLEVYRHLLLLLRGTKKGQGQGTRVMFGCGMVVGWETRAAAEAGVRKGVGR